jgi:putative PEP-CTERM system histidine kinase
MSPLHRLFRRASTWLASAGWPGQREVPQSCYNHRLIWKCLNELTTSRADAVDLGRDLVRLVSHHFPVLSVSIWFVSADRATLELAAATGPMKDDSELETQLRMFDTTTLKQFKEHPRAVDLEGRAAPWISTLRKTYPSALPRNGPRICAPLVARGEFLGVLLLGDGIGPRAFDTTDFEALEYVTEHVASSLLNIQLSERLMQTKQLVAFQMMAAFFVHDLKNSASTLNLTLRNLPLHFGDPAFRQDALRGVTKTVEHINRLVDRFSALRHEFTHELVECDLNELVDRTLSHFESPSELVVEKRLAPAPKIPIDPDQMANVITNLVLNARDAMDGKGVVRVATRHENDWVVLAVADHGCGMSSEFVRSSLFRPFKTTKKTGLGIGMFQSKMIVETHGGRISVSSAPGKGATFQVFLPTRQTA